MPIHFPTKAKHVIHLFMNGGPSHVDTFDPKPELARLDGKTASMKNLKTERPDRRGAEVAVHVQKLRRVWVAG